LRCNFVVTAPLLLRLCAPSIWSFLRNHRPDDFYEIIIFGLRTFLFTSPVPIPSRARLWATLDEIEEIEGGARGNFNLQFAVEGKKNPAGVAEAVNRYCA
jgi:hypothetical protein